MSAEDEHIREVRAGIAAELQDALPSKGKSVEQLDAEHVNDAPGGVLPVTWSDGHTGQRMRGNPLVVLPSDFDVNAFGSQRAATCGQCKSYDLEGGRKEIAGQRFLERVVLEEKWQLHHLGELQSLGICRERPSMAVSYTSGACESFRPRSIRR